MNSEYFLSFIVWPTSLAYEYHARLKSKNCSGRNSGEISICCRQRGLRVFILVAELTVFVHVFSLGAAAAVAVATVVVVVVVVVVVAVSVTGAFVVFGAAALIMPLAGLVIRYVSGGGLYGLRNVFSVLRCRLELLSLYVWWTECNCPRASGLQGSRAQGLTFWGLEVW